MKLAASFKIPVKKTCRSGIIDVLIKSSRSPSLLNYFTSTKSFSKSRLRLLYVQSFIFSVSHSLCIIEIVFGNAGLCGFRVVLFDRYICIWVICLFVVFLEPKVP